MNISQDYLNQAVIFLVSDYLSIHV